MALPPAPKLAPKPVNPQESEVARLLKLTARETERHAYLAWRTAISSGSGPTKRTILYGVDYANPDTPEWKHDGKCSVGAWVVVTKPGPIGAFITVNRDRVPADMIGGRTRVFAMDPNDCLDIRFSDASIEAALFVATPEPAVRETPV